MWDKKGKNFVIVLIIKYKSNRWININYKIC